jgi:hypothetical protein
MIISFNHSGPYTKEKEATVRIKLARQIADRTPCACSGTEKTVTITFVTGGLNAICCCDAVSAEILRMFAFPDMR